MKYIAHKQIGSGKEKISSCITGWATRQVTILCSHTLILMITLTFLPTCAATVVPKKCEGHIQWKKRAHDAITLINSLGWNEFHLIGHSMSGMIVQKIAVNNRARVKSVVAITPVPAAGSLPKEMMDFFESAALNNDGAAMGCINTLTSNRYTNAFAKKMVIHLRQWSTNEARLGYMNMFFYTDFSESVKGLCTPILVLFGEYDFEEKKPACVIHF